MSVPLRYRFGGFVLSPRQRTLVRDGQTVPLIPKYLDVLLVLVRRRHEAVSKAELFDEVWRDVVVSDGALSQAVRTLRRALDDGAREPRFIRTVSRHGYQFVWADVVEEPDELVAVASPARVPLHVGDDVLDRWVDQLLTAAARGPAGDEEARDAAAQLHQLDTGRATARLIARPRHARALAIMKDARWDVPAAGPVPLLADVEAGAAIWQTLRLRLAASRPALGRRWTLAAVTAGAGGAAAGVSGGIVLVLLAPRATGNAPIALGAVGWLAGTAGGAALGAGLAVAEAAARSHRRLALVASASVAGLVAASVAHVVTRALLEGLFGIGGLTVPGAVDGLVMGGMAGLGYAVATRHSPGGTLAAPTGRARLAAAGVVGFACALGAVAIALVGRPLVGGLVHEISRASAEPQLGLAPLGRILGEPDFGAATRVTLAALEGLALGMSVTWGVTARPRRAP